MRWANEVEDEERKTMETDEYEEEDRTTLSDFYVAKEVEKTVVVDGQAKEMGGGGVTRIYVDELWYWTAD